MKISEKWLRQWIESNDSFDALTTDELAEQLTMAGLEIDGIESVATDFSGVVVGNVVEVNPHPDADKLRITKVDVGVASTDGELLQIVCGAPNVYAGMRAPVAMVGALLPNVDNDTDSKPFKIKKSKLRGVESQGMLCGASEIGLADRVDGLLELPSDAPVGADIRDYLKLDTKILDVSITPNRGDCFSVRGLAREVAVINELPLNPPSITAPDITTDDTQAVKVTAIEACPRYLAQPINNINRQITTPQWMTEYLMQSGLRSHNFLVDVTNYVMLELGQPLHAFDADKIEGDIEVRIAKADETFELLNEQTITLKGDELIIADDAGVLALAGIMGGMRSSITDETKNIILESAFFSPLAIAGRARRYKLHTDASQRFERGVDFDISPIALARTSQLLVDIAQGSAGKVSCAESTEHLPKREPITLTYHKISDVLGIDIDINTVKRILTDLEIEVSQPEASTQASDIALICQPPSHRFDLTMQQDLIEEIARIYGYDNIPSQLPNLQVDMSYDDSSDLTLGLKLALTDAGYMEAISFSFSDAKLEGVLEDKALGNVLPLANPISSDLAVMRRTLLSSLLPCVQYNLNRNQPRVRFFEMGLSFVGATVSELVQTPMVALVATGEVYPEQAYNNHEMGFFDLKRDVEQLLPANITGDTTDAQRLNYRRSQLAFLHPGQSADMVLDGRVIGWLGQLHPSIADKLDMPITWVAQIELEPILNLARETQDIVPLSKFPQVRRDIALLVDADIEREALSNTIQQAGGALLERHWLFDVYQGEHMTQGMRSVAFALIWQDATQTLSDEAIKSATDKVVLALQDKHGAKLRDS